ncbi:FAD-dependent monooxygenase [Paracraurococcus lichenis]|uniref:FAD-dependent monooxygenase n=1 Tax=Paracraurococcus lichenis TaxID=3064888 RepID=A0ABT9DTA6_9PROT|nr:FAD-dependent monooxygenase [Paracraurococcus sp. LOR1-02]MDO9707127.1 FAD-dependent monooxygenase [Paracraurococcus sp. LOR1-02]
MLEIPVLIIGGGPVGLTASLLLSRAGVRSLLVERHDGTSRVPKARGINARTMEMYRQLGLEEDIHAAGLSAGSTGLIVWTESLAGREIERRVPGRALPKNLAVTPTTNCLCAQDDLEPVLRRHAEAAGLGDVRFATEMTAFRRDANGISATIRDLATGAETGIRARWLIAADGAQSRVRRAMGVRMPGEEKVYDSVNILVRADLTEWVKDRPAALYFVEQPSLRGTFLTINARDRWGFLIHSLAHYGYRPADFTPEFCTALVRQAAGLPDLPVEVLGVSYWEASAIVAERYRDGRMFLAGDAAHEIPPTGGFGMNTGVQDVLNLCWKLAAVERGEAGEALLDSYDAERRPLAELTTRTSLANALSMGRTAKQSSAVLPRREFLNEQGLIFGVPYESAAVLADGTPPLMPEDPITEYLPSARPGSRAPHVWLQQGDTRLSTIDLLGKRFVLLAGREGAGWAAAARALAGSGNPPMSAHVIGGRLADPENAWHAAYEVSPRGAVLVRPDGYVAWRSRDGAADPEGVLRDALDRLLGRQAA